MNATLYIIAEIACDGPIKCAFISICTDGKNVVPKPLIEKYS